MVAEVIRVKEREAEVTWVEGTKAEVKKMGLR